MSIHFGEEMAYWYLRLNGFLLISNFVLHRGNDNEIEHSADADLLAIRMPGACESIAGQALECDDSFLKKIADRYDRKTLGLYVEVKTGKAPSLENSFSAERLRYARKRLGKNFADLVNADPNQEPKEATLSRGKFSFGKVLIYDEQRSGKIERTDCIQLPLSDVDSFLRERLCPIEKEMIANTKSSDRLFFQSELIQYLLWRDPPTKTKAITPGPGALKRNRPDA